MPREPAGLRRHRIPRLPGGEPALAVRIVGELLGDPPDLVGDAVHRADVVAVQVAGLRAACGIGAVHRYHLIPRAQEVPVLRDTRLYLLFLVTTANVGDRAVGRGDDALLDALARRSVLEVHPAPALG